MSSVSIIDTLRRRIKDDRPNRAALHISVTSPDVNSALLEVLEGRLIVQVRSTSSIKIPSIDWSLSDARYATVGRLFQQLSALPGYTVNLDEDANASHESHDIRPVPPVAIGPNCAAAVLRHHTFSDRELDDVIEEAVRRHNPSMTSASIPTSEETFVLQLAHIGVYHRMAADAAKRAGTSETVADLLALIGSLQSEYSADVKRLARAITSPSEATPNTMGSGDIVEGTLYRSSSRTGYRSPLSAQNAPAPAVLSEPDDVRDVEDETILFRWVRNKDNSFYSYELWMSTDDEVERGSAGILGTGLGDVPSNMLGRRLTTAKLVYQSKGANANGTGLSKFQSVLQAGQLITSVEVRELEPNTAYYARLYAVDLNGEVSSSPVVRYVTKSLRCRFLPSITALSTYKADPGEVLTVIFDDERAAFTASHTLLLEGVRLTPTIIGPHSVSFVMPSFLNRRMVKQLVVRSPNGLTDILPTGIKVTEDGS